MPSTRHNDQQQIPPHLSSKSPNHITINKSIEPFPFPYLSLSPSSSVFYQFPSLVKCRGCTDEYDAVHGQADNGSLPGQGPHRPHQPEPEPEPEQPQAQQRPKRRR